jgi:hypothetical protein
VRGDRGGEFVIKGPQVFLTPKIAHSLGPGNAKVSPLHGDLGLGRPEVEEADGPGAVIEWLRIDVEIALIRGVLETSVACLPRLSWSTSRTSSLLSL